MTNPSEMTDEQMVEKASKRHCWPTQSMAEAYEAGFINGCRERDFNPSPKVQELVNRMHELGQALPPNAISMEIQKALANFRKEG